MNDNQKEAIEVLKFAGSVFIGLSLIFGYGFIATLLIPLDIITLFRWGLWFHTMEKGDKKAERWLV